MDEKDIEKRLDQLLLGAAEGEQGRRKLARSFALVNSSLMQREQLRLGKKLGRDHARVAALEHKTSLIIDSARRVAPAVKPEVAAAAVKASEAVINGRIVDENLVGVASVEVYLADETGAAVSGVDSITTDKAGNYQFVLPKSKAVSGESGKNFRIVVATPGKDRIHEDPAPLTAALGEAKRRDLVINRARLIRGKR